MKKDKSNWIKETQMFQRIARNGADADSDEVLGQAWDQDQAARKLRKIK